MNTNATNNTEPVVAIVVAAGSGVRLGPGELKALREVRGVPLVVRTCRRLVAGGCTHLVVVVPDERAADFAAVLDAAGLNYRLVGGGERRQDSVRHGLGLLDADADLASTRIVLVHDAARAFVPPAVVRRVIDAVAAGSVAVTPVVEVTDSIRELNDAGSAVVERSRLRAVQTPQGFDRDTLVEAHLLVDENQYPVTDDAAACEYAGHTVTLVEGDREAIKITDPLDLVVAEALAAREDA